MDPFVAAARAVWKPIRVVGRPVQVPDVICMRLTVLGAQARFAKEVAVVVVRIPIISLLRPA